MNAPMDVEYVGTGLPRPSGSIIPPMCGRGKPVPTSPDDLTNAPITFC